MVSYHTITTRTVVILSLYSRAREIGSSTLDKIDLDFQKRNERERELKSDAESSEKMIQIVTIRYTSEVTA